MESVLGYLVPPVVGAFIGAATNDIAIRMLFRPYRAWHVGGVRVPLTPGLIPREREQISGAIAETFVEHVLTSGEVARMVLSDNVKQELRDKVGELLDKLSGLLNINAAMLGMAKATAGNYLVQEIGTLTDRVGENSDAIRLHIKQKIDSLDVRQLEALVLGFSRKQFRAITWFGALLGFMIGTLQVVMFS